MIMSASTTSESIGNSIAETALFGQKSLAQLTRSYECWMKGVMNVAMQQIELGRGLLEGSVEDLNLLTQVRTPDAFCQAEFEMLRRRYERAIGVAQKITEELNRTWAEVSEFAQSEMKAD
jgi:hypothetical protein